MAGQGQSKNLPRQQHNQFSEDSDPESPLRDTKMVTEKLERHHNRDPEPLDNDHEVSESESDHGQPRDHAQVQLQANQVWNFLASPKFP